MQEMRLRKIKQFVQDLNTRKAIQSSGSSQQIKTCLLILMQILGMTDKKFITMLENKECPWYEKHEEKKNQTIYKGCVTEKIRMVPRVHILRKGDIKSRKKGAHLA